MLLKFQRPKVIYLIPANMPMPWFETFVGMASGKHYIKCDGVDDGVFFNEAIDSLPKNPGGKVIPLGDTFAIGTTIVGVSSLWAQGIGPSTILQPTAALNGDVFWAESKTNIKLSDMTIDGNKAVAVNSLSGVSLRGCTDCELETMEIFDTVRQGVHSRSIPGFNSRRHKYRHIRIWDTDGKGMLVYTEGGGIPQEYLLFDVHITGTTGEEGAQLLLRQSQLIAVEVDVTPATTGIGLTLAGDDAPAYADGNNFVLFPRIKSTEIGLELGLGQRGLQVIGGRIEQTTANQPGGLPGPQAIAFRDPGIADSENCVLVGVEVVAARYALDGRFATGLRVTGCTFIKSGNAVDPQVPLVRLTDYSNFAGNVVDASLSDEDFVLVYLASAHDVSVTPNTLIGSSGAAQTGIKADAANLENTVAPNTFHNIAARYDMVDDGLMGLRTSRRRHTAEFVGSMKLNNDADLAEGTSIWGGCFFGAQKTVTEGAGAAVIKTAISTEGSLYVISGLYTAGPARFRDVVAASGVAGAPAPAVINGVNTQGAPGARTYSVAGENLRLAIAGGAPGVDYTIYVSGMGGDES